MPAFHHARLCSTLARAAAALALAVLPGLAGPRRPAAAASYVVNSLADPGDGNCGDGSCTLRDALLAANGSPGSDTITFAVSGVIVLSTALPAIVEPLTLDGSGQTVAVDGNQAVRVFRATAPVIFRHLTVQNGRAAGDGGGALFNAAATLSHVTFVSNTAVNGSGGGARFISTATVNHTAFVGNTATNGNGGGAAFDERVTISDSDFQNNKAASGQGGGAYFSSSVTLGRTTFSGNSARLGGGARFGGQAAVSEAVFQNNTATHADGGGARFGSLASVSATTFAGNTAPNGNGGGAYFDGQAEVIGAAFSGNTAGVTGGGAAFGQGATVRGTLFNNNQAVQGGGGADFAQSVTILNTAFAGNAAPSGSGGGAAFTGHATLINTTLTDNSAGGTGGGGGARFASTATIAGGAFESNTASQGTGGGARFLSTATITNTTFADNTTPNQGGGAHFLGPAAITGARFSANAAGEGGGLFAEGSQILVQASVFEANTAASRGGGLAVTQAASGQVKNSQLLRNQAASGGGLVIDGGADLSLDNNLFGANTAGGAGSAADIAVAGAGSHLTGRHNTLAAAVAGSGLALNDSGSAGQAIALTNSIFDGYVVGVRASGPAPDVSLHGVLWSSVTTPTVAIGIEVTGAFEGAADFVNPAADDYHLQNTSTAVDAGASAGLTADFEGDPRPQDGGFDFGFDEVPSRFTPGVVDDDATTPEDMPVTLNVLDNDPNPSGQTLSVLAVGSPDHGTASLNGSTLIKFTPALNYHGSAVFTYTAGYDGFTYTGTVRVKVTPVNDAPVITGPGDLAVAAGGSTGPLSYSVYDIEDGEALTVTAASDNTALVPNANIVLSGSGAQRAVSVAPAWGVGQARITLTVSDSEGAAAQYSFVLEVGFWQWLPLIWR